MVLNLDMVSSMSEAALIAGMNGAAEAQLTPNMRLPGRKFESLSQPKEFTRSTKRLGSACVVAHVGACRVHRRTRESCLWPT